MKPLLPDAMLIGFTGTPLLKSDKQSSIETFGPYIHTYKYDEAVHGANETSLVVGFPGCRCYPRTA